MLDYVSEDAGGGLTRYTVFVDADDGLLQSVFLDLSFTGPFNEILYLGTADAPDDDPTYLGDSVYAAQQGQDTFFFAEENFRTGLVGQFFDITHVGGTYEILAGSGGGSQLLRFALAQLVAPTGASVPIVYTGIISRGGANYGVQGTIPIPEPAPLALLMASIVALLGRPRRLRPKR
jgi:hypothetical protein